MNISPMISTARPVGKLMKKHIKKGGNSMKARCHTHPLGPKTAIQPWVMTLKYQELVTT